MSRSRQRSLVVALLAFSALATSATALDTTVTAEPEDEINLDWDQLPLSPAEAGDIQAEMVDSADEGSGTSGGTGGIQNGNGGGAATKTPDREKKSEGEAEGDVERESGPGGEGSRDAGGSGDSTADASAWGATAQNLVLNWLFIPSMMDLYVVLGVAIVGSAAGLAYRSRRNEPELTENSVVDADSWPPTDPGNSVDRAYVYLIREVSPSQPRTTTPAECVQLAREEGLDMTAVEAITTAFERVHYGGHTISAEQSRAQEGLDRLKESTK